MRHGGKQVEVEIQRQRKVLNEYREWTSEYSAWQRAWCGYEVRRGGESINRQEVQPFAYALLTFSWSDVIDPFGNGERIGEDHVIIMDGSNYDIDLINDSDPLKRKVIVHVIKKRDPM